MRGRNVEWAEKAVREAASLSADQALKMHYGEIEERNIKGTATVQEANDLKEEGVDVIPLPDITKNNLN